MLFAANCSMSFSNPSRFIEQGSRASWNISVVPAQSGIVVTGCLQSKVDNDGSGGKDF